MNLNISLHRTSTFNNLPSQKRNSTIAAFKKEPIHKRSLSTILKKSETLSLLQKRSKKPLEGLTLNDISNPTAQALDKYLKKSLTNRQNSSGPRPSKINLPIFPEGHEKIFPEWLTAREDFQKKYSEIMVKETSDLAQIASKYLTIRTDDEKRALYKWVSNADFFRSLPQMIVRDLADNLHCLQLKKGEIIFKQGTIGECLYVVYKGTVGIFLGNDRVAHCDEGGFFGELALDKESVRSADVVAETDVVLFTLADLDYKRIVFSYKNLEKQINLKIIVNIPFFMALSYVKMQNMLNSCASATFHTDEIIYDNGSKSHCFFIVKSGRVELQTFVEIEKVNKWPIGSHLWNVRKIKSKYAYPIKTLKEGDYFGEWELFNKIDRKTRAVATETSMCLMLNQQEFEKCLGSRDDNMIKGIDKDYEFKILDAEKKFKNSVHQEKEMRNFLTKSISKNSEKSKRLKESILIRKEHETSLMRKRIVNNVTKEKIKDLKDLKNPEIPKIFKSFDADSRQIKSMKKFVKLH